MGGNGVDKKLLVTDFCRGVWGGVAYRVQRRYLEKKYRQLEGRESHLWDVKDLEKSEYKVGTIITDHFEVMEHTDDKVRISSSPFPALIPIFPLLLPPLLIPLSRLPCDR